MILCSHHDYLNIAIRFYITACGHKDILIITDKYIRSYFLSSIGDPHGHNWALFAETTGKRNNANYFFWWPISTTNNEFGIQLSCCASFWSCYEHTGLRNNMIILFPIEFFPGMLSGIVVYCWLIHMQSQPSLKYLYWDLLFKSFN